MIKRRKLDCISSKTLKHLLKNDVCLDMIAIIFSFHDLKKIAQYRLVCKSFKNCMEKKALCTFNVKSDKFPSFKYYYYQGVSIYNQLQLYDLLGNIKRLKDLKHVWIEYDFTDLDAYRLENLCLQKSIINIDLRCDKITKFYWLDNALSGKTRIHLRGLNVKCKQHDIFTRVLCCRHFISILLEGFNFSNYDFFREINTENLQLSFVKMKKREDIAKYVMKQLAENNNVKLIDFYALYVTSMSCSIFSKYLDRKDKPKLIFENIKFDNVTYELIMEWMDWKAKYGKRFIIKSFSKFQTKTCTIDLENIFC